MIAREYRAWLGGLLEGLAGRTIDQTTLDGYINRIEKSHPAAFGPRRLEPKLAGPEDSSDAESWGTDERDADLTVYDGPGVLPQADVPPPMTAADLKALRGADGKAKKVEKIVRAAAKARPVNSTPVVRGMDNVPEADPLKAGTSEDSDVVRMG